MYKEFEEIFSEQRMDSYNYACAGDFSLSLDLYNLNTRLSLELFGVISFFEVALRNRIDNVMLSKFKEGWLVNSIEKNGFFKKAETYAISQRHKKEHIETLSTAIKKINDIIDFFEKEITKGRIEEYYHNDILTKLNFSFWEKLYTEKQFRAVGGNELVEDVFTNHPFKRKIYHNRGENFHIKDGNKYYNFSYQYIRSKLHTINRLRNRIAHHESIIFSEDKTTISIEYPIKGYEIMLNFFKWMGYDEKLITTTFCCELYFSKIKDLKSLVEV